MNWNWNTAVMVVMGGVAILAWIKARLAHRKIRTINNAINEICRAGKMQLDLFVKHRGRIDECQRRLNFLQSDLRRIWPERTAAESQAVLDKVDQMDKRLKCTTDGHLDPVCPRCGESLVLAVPEADPPRRRTRMIRPGKPDTAELPAADA